MNIRALPVAPCKTAKMKLAFGAALGIALGAIAACGGSSIPDLPIGHLTVSSTPVDFGLSPCGATSPAAPVTLANDETSSPIHWTATVEGPFVIDGASSGTLASHTSKKLAVRAAVPSSAVAAVCGVH